MYLGRGAKRSKERSRRKLATSAACCFNELGLIRFGGSKAEGSPFPGLSSCRSTGPFLFSGAPGVVGGLGCARPVPGAGTSWSSSHNVLVHPAGNLAEGNACFSGPRRCGRPGAFVTSNGRGGTIEGEAHGAEPPTWHRPSEPHACQFTSEVDHDTIPPTEGRASLNGHRQPDQDRAASGPGG